jgi:hypothetical protein
MKVLGIDLLSGSPHSRSPPRYSVVLLEEGIARWKEEVDRSRLLDLIQKTRPERIACDNVYELFVKKGMRSFFSALPSGIQVVQVNGPPWAMEPLHIVARRNGIPLSSRSSSMEEAWACARLADRGVGALATPFEEGWRIVVSRARSPGRGGQSQDRYRRKIHSMVSSVVKGIQPILDERKVSYDLRTVKADGGLSRGTFRVRCPREKLRGIRERKGPDVQVRILPLERENLAFLPSQDREGAVILGVDPGTTTALAVLDLQGDLREVQSARGLSLEDALTVTSRYGGVLSVASDVPVPPRFVERLASALRSPLYAPSRPLTVAEKTEVVNRRFGKDSYQNAHERDALAAAIKAYNRLAAKRSKGGEEWERGLLERVKGARALPSRGQRARRAVSSRPRGGAGEGKGGRSETPPNEVKLLLRSLRKEIRALKAEREDLKRAVEGLEKEKGRILAKLEEVKRGEMRAIWREREIRKRDGRIRDLKRRLKREEARRKEIERRIDGLGGPASEGEAGDLIPVKRLTRPTREEVQRARKTSRIREGDVLFIEDPRGGGWSWMETLTEMKVRAVIADAKALPALPSGTLRKVPLLSPDRLEVRWTSEGGFVDRKCLEEEIRREEERLRRRESRERKEWLEGVIQDYRRKRWKDLKKS